MSWKSTLSTETVAAVIVRAVHFVPDHISSRFIAEFPVAVNVQVTVIGHAIVTAHVLFAHHVIVRVAYVTDAESVNCVVLDHTVIFTILKFLHHDDIVALFQVIFIVDVFGLNVSVPAT